MEVAHVDVVKLVEGVFYLPDTGRAGQIVQLKGEGGLALAGIVLAPVEGFLAELGVDDQHRAGVYPGTRGGSLGIIDDLGELLLEVIA